MKATYAGGAQGKCQLRLAPLFRPSGAKLVFPVLLLVRSQFEKTHQHLHTLVKTTKAVKNQMKPKGHHAKPKKHQATARGCYVHVGAFGHHEG